MKDNIRLMSIFEEVEKYGTDAIDNIELVSELVGAKLNVTKELADEFLTVQKACVNATHKRGKLTKVQAYKMNLLGELLSRNITQVQEDDEKMDSPEKISKLYMQEFKHYEVEHFDILLLNTKNAIIKRVNISKGTLNASIVHPRDVFREAMKHNANAIILMHNHPSGDPRPSVEDVNITKRLADAGDLVGIKVIDHIVFGNNQYVSFKQSNLVF